MTPIAEGQTRYLYATGVESRIATPEMLEGMFEVVNAAFAEDKRMIEGQQAIWTLTPPDLRKVFIPQDKAPAQFRRIISRRLAEESSQIAPKRGDVNARSMPD